MRKAFKDIVKDELKKNNVEVLELFGREYAKEGCAYITVNNYCEFIIVRNILKPLIEEINSKNPYEYFVSVKVDYRLSHDHYVSKLV